MKIKITYWIPLAENLFSYIESQLSLKNISFSKESNNLDFYCKIDVSNNNSLENKVLISSKGFIEIETNYSYDMTNFNSDLSTLIEEINTLILDIIPDAVQNKIGIIMEGLYKFRDFNSKYLSKSYLEPAKSFLKFYNIIRFDLEKYKLDEGIFIQFEEKSISSKELSFNYSFYAYKENDNNYKNSKNKLIEKIILKNIDILKDIRTNIIPLRRQYSRALQYPTKEYFEWFLNFKKYLIYISVKLPIYKKIITHIEELNIPSVASNSDFNRLKIVFQESVDEIKAISDDLSFLLNEELESEHLNITEQELETSSNLVELNRKGKNRANALKLLSIILSSTIGLNIAELLNKYWWKVSQDFLILSIKLLSMIMAPLFVHFILERKIKTKSKIFRIIIPFSENKFAVNKIIANIKHNNITNDYIYGKQRLITWQSKYDKVYKKEEFNITVNFNMNNFVNNLTVEIEHKKMDFEVKELIKEVLLEFSKLGVLDNKKGEYSILADVYKGLGLNIDKELVGLVDILHLHEDDLRVILNSDDDNYFIENSVKSHIIENIDSYYTWLDKQQNTPEEILFGKENLRKKIDLLREIKKTKSNKKYSAFGR